MAARTIGALMVSSLMILPVATAMLFAKSYRRAVLFAMLCGALSVLSGLTVSFYMGLKPGGAIVLIGIGIFLLSLLVQQMQRIRNRSVSRP